MALFRRLANLFSRSKVDRDINAELEAHINLRIDANLAAGMSPEAARRDAYEQGRAAAREEQAEWRRECAAGLAEAVDRIRL